MRTEQDKQMEREARAAMRRHTTARSMDTCPGCGQFKAPGLVFCFDCFQRNHIGHGNYSPEARRLLNSIEADNTDPWTGE